MFVGRGKRYSVKQLSNGTGIADRMIESFMAQVDSTDFRKPDVEELLTLCSFIGPEFTTEVLILAQQAAVWLPETDGTPPGALAADNAEDNAELARRAADGSFEGDEQALKVVGTRMMGRGAQLVALAANG
jgi:hypothetical protein